MDVDVESGKWKVDRCGKWKVDSGAVPDLTYVMYCNSHLTGNVNQALRTALSFL